MRQHAPQKTPRFREVQYGDMEEWKPVRGYNGKYAVSSYGRIKNRKRPLSVRLHKYNGRPQVELWKDGTRKTLNVHRLVALAFLEKPGPEEKLVVDHIDRDKANNKIENLRWATYSENNKNKASYIRVCKHCGLTT